MQEKQIQPNESLAIISNMINTAKHKIADDGFLLIFWGWLVTLTAVLHYAGWQTGIERHYMVWSVLMPLGGIISLIYGFRRKKSERVTTHTDVYLGYSWGAFMIALAISLLFMKVHGWTVTYFFMMLLYGMATFISGGLLNFRPLIIGSLFSFLIAGISVFMPAPEKLLCMAASIFCSYVVPGHLLRKEYRSQNNV